MLTLIRILTLIAQADLHSTPSGLPDSGSNDRRNGVKSTSGPGILPWECHCGVRVAVKG